MDLSGIASLSTALSQSNTAQAAQLLVQKKAMEIEEQSALALLQALPQTASNPPHLGQNIDVKA